MAQKAAKSDYISLEQQGNTDLEGFSNDWLSKQFNRIPFLLYKYWLLLNFPISLGLELILLGLWVDVIFRSQCIQVEPLTDHLKFLLISEIYMTINPLFFMYGCCQVLYAIKQKKSGVAQEGFVKLQYSLITSAIAMGYVLSLVDTGQGLWLFLFYFVLSSVVHCVGGFAVVRVFKKNHPLTRLAEGSKIPEDLNNRDFLEQNEAIASEFSKYDKQLNAWPYFLYRCLLKFSVIAEISFAFRFTFRYLLITWQKLQSDENASNIDLYILAGLVFSSVLNAFACFHMEIATRTRMLKKLKRALVMIKICTLLSIIKCPLTIRYISLDKKFIDYDSSSLFWFACSVLAPPLCLIGSLKAKK